MSRHHRYNMDDGGDLIYFLPLLLLIAILFFSSDGDKESAGESITKTESPIMEPLTDGLIHEPIVESGIIEPIVESGIIERKVR